jgi:hypothetical protein
MRKLVLIVAAMALLGVVGVNLAQSEPPPPHAPCSPRKLATRWYQRPH